MKKLQVLEKFGKVLVLINREDTVCPNCGRKMFFADYSDDGISLNCSYCNIFRCFDFVERQQNLYPKPKLQVR